MKFLMAVSLLVLVGCQTPAQLCQEQGWSPGTHEFNNCVSQERARQAELAASMNASMAPLNSPQQSNMGYGGGSRQWCVYDNFGNSKGCFDSRYDCLNSLQYRGGYQVSCDLE